MKKIVFFTGAGMSAESGISTFRDSDGLWENHNIEDVATPEGWHKNPQLVLDFYNQRRKQLIESKPNLGHQLIADLQDKYQVDVITQNVDNLHERAGSRDVLHLHGELTKVRSTKKPNLIHELDGWELKLGDLCELGSQLRPHIVWFGEAVPEMDNAAKITAEADIFIVIGTSLNVYPAAGLLSLTKPSTKVFVIDPNTPQVGSIPNLTIINKGASEGMKDITNILLKDI